jgi:hypothetical protein
LCRFDYYRTPFTPSSRSSGCVQLTDFTAWKIWEYGIFGKLDLRYANIVSVKLLDCRAGIYIHLYGAVSLTHQIRDSVVTVKNSLIVGHSANGNCDNTRPSLYACKHFMSYCSHLQKHNIGIFLPVFHSGGGDPPKIKPWWDAGKKCTKGYS